MFIKLVEWINEDIREAEVTVSDGFYNIVCFSHPFNKGINDTISEPLNCIEVKNVVTSKRQILYANKDSTSFEYCLL